MGNSLFNIAVSGLNAAQAGLNTTGHNITNASTPGFTRQQIVQGTNIAQFTGGGFIGQGTNVETVQRVYNDFLTKQAAAAQSTQGALQAYSDQITQVDNMLADPASGLTPALQGFFSGVQGLAANPGSNPSSTPSRQAMLSDSQTLVGSFNRLNQQLSDQQDNVNSQIKSTISSINSYAQQLVQVNKDISTTQVAGASQPANDLLDQRDKILSDLSKLVGAQSIIQSDGSLNVYVGNGVPLVVGNQAVTLQTSASQSLPGQLDITLQMPGQKISTFPQAQVTGGTLGGLLDFQNGTLAKAQNQLGQVAVSLAESFNNQHQLGLDLNGNVGKAFFSLGSIPVQANSLNVSQAANVVTASYDKTNVSALTASDYRVDYTGSAFQVTRLSDNTVVGSPNLTPPPTPPATNTSVTTDGVTFTFSGTPSAGDSYIVQPTRKAASGIAVIITDPNQIAAAAAARTTAAVTNGGTGKISAPTIYSASNLASLLPAANAANPNIGMTYDGTTNPAAPVLNFTNLPATTAVQITHTAGGTTTYTQYAAGFNTPVATPIPYTLGDTVSFATSFSPAPPAAAQTGDLSFTLTGQPGRSTYST